VGRYEYTYISQWNNTKEGWLMVVGDLFKPERFTFGSPKVCPLSSAKML
jgi:hypothetical protein